MPDTTPALLTIVNPDATVPDLEEASESIRAAHPDRPRAYLVTLLAAEALEARAALKPLQRHLRAIEEAYAKRLAETCETCFWQEGDLCLKFSEPYERFGSCRAGYKPRKGRPDIGRGLPVEISQSWAS